MLYQINMKKVVKYVIVWFLCRNRSSTDLRCLRKINFNYYGTWMAMAWQRHILVIKIHWPCHFHPYAIEVKVYFKLIYSQYLRRASAALRWVLGSLPIILYGTKIITLKKNCYFVYVNLCLPLQRLKSVALC